MRLPAFSVPPRAAFLLPVLGALGFFAGSSLSLRQSGRFFLWSLATMAWILLVFLLIVRGRLSGPLVRVAVPAVAMIAISTVASLLFLDLVAPRQAFIVVLTVVLYLFLEHVRREVAHPDPAEVLSITEFARMVNIGSLFLLAVVGIGLTFFLTLPMRYTVPPFAALAVLWSWHLFGACYKDCGKNVPLYVALAAAVVIEAYLVVLRLPTSIFVGGAVVAVVYYLAASVLRASIEKRVTARLIRRYAAAGLGLLLLLLLTARWI